MPEVYFSIIIPCFNSAAYINRCINSLNKQKFKNFEAIFIDDCSKDDTYKILKDFENSNNNFKVLQTNKNSGPATARNLGISIARGKYVCFLDSDDWWFKFKLSTVYEYSLKNTEEIFCHNELLFLNEKLKKKLKYEIKDKNFYEHLLLESNQLSTSATTVSLNFIRKNNILFNEENTHFSVEDYDFWLKLTFYGARIKFINKFLGTYNKHKYNISSEHEMHKSNVLNVIRNHSFNIQKISKNKNKIWKKARLRVYLHDIKNEINEFGVSFKILIKILIIFNKSPIIFLKYTLKKFFG